MKKNTLLGLLLINVAVQCQTFDGVSISGHLNKCVQAFQAKGYKLVTYNDVGAIMKGVINHENVELYVIKTPITAQVWKVSIYFPKRTSWSQLTSDYKEYTDIITNKYGSRSKEYKFFESPYEDGDGYELIALKVGKATYSTYWLLDDVNIAVKISEYAQVTLAYENVKNVELNDRETEKLNRTKF